VAQRILYFVRHGQYDWASSEKLGGPLTTTGRKQARKTATRLKDIPFTTIYHSDLPRAIETATLISQKLPGVPLRPSRLLRECFPYPPLHVPEWLEQIPIERLEKDANQATRALDKFFRPTRGKDKYELLVCHGNIIRFFVCCALGTPPENWPNADIHNCSISEIRVDPDGGLRLISHNDTGHLPLALRTLS
jgi:serine/threonine-protein phosphatase PGAM5